MKCTNTWVYQHCNHIGNHWLIFPLAHGQFNPPPLLYSLSAIKCGPLICHLRLKHYKEGHFPITTKGFLIRSLTCSQLFFNGSISQGLDLPSPSHWGYPKWLNMPPPFYCGPTWQACLLFISINCPSVHTNLYLQHSTFMHLPTE